MSTQNRNRIARREWYWVWAIIIFVLLLTSLPYMYGYLSSPPDRQFMGLMLDIPDHGQYLSWWRSFQSSLLVSNKLTPEPNEPLFFNLLWWTLAQISRWTGLDYAPLFQAFRWLVGASFLWAVYRLIALFLSRVDYRRIAFLMITFSSGLGWILIVLKYTLTQGELLYPLDIYIAEGNSFLCVLAFPHFTLALTFIALVFEFFWRGWQAKQYRYTVIAGVLALLLGWTHTYDLLIIYSVIGIFAGSIWLQTRAFPWRLFRSGVIIAGLSFSGAVYSVILTSVDPLWEEVLAQFANAGVFTPSPPHLVILFGFPLILAIATCIRLVARKQWTVENLFIASWFLAGAVLNYIPTDFQIHMLNSWQIPMMILATKGLFELIIPAIVHRRVIRSILPLKRNTQFLIIAILLLAVLPTNIYLWTWRFIDLARHDYPYYLYQEDLAALEWLRENSPGDKVVLSSITIGQFVPAISGNSAFLAHWAQTVGFYEKENYVAQFFDDDTPDQQRLQTLSNFGVDYVFHGPAERALGSYDPATMPHLERVFASPRVKLYRVKPSDAARIEN